MEFTDLGKIAVDLAKISPWLSLIAFPFFLLFGWQRWLENSLRLSKERSVRLVELLKDMRWQRAHHGELEIAVNEAFGCNLDGRWIALAFRRSRSLVILKESARASSLIRISEDGNHFEDVAGHRRIPLLFWVTFLFVLSILPWTVMMVLVEIKTKLAPQEAIGLLFCGVTYTPMCIWLASRIESARRLIFKLDERHPMMDLQGVPALPSRKFVAVTAVGNGRSAFRINRSE